MKISLTKIERGGILDVVMSLQGINRSDALLLRSIEIKLELREVTVLQQSELDDNSEYDLSDIEIEWLSVVIDKQFGASAINPRLASSVLSVESKLKDLKNADD